MFGQMMFCILFAVFSTWVSYFISGILSEIGVYSTPVGIMSGFVGSMMWLLVRGRGTQK